MYRRGRPGKNAMALNIWAVLELDKRYDDEEIDT